MQDDVRSAIQDARAKRLELIQKSITNAEEVMKDEDAVQKAEEEALFEKAIEEEQETEEQEQQDVEKSDIADALSRCDGGVKIKKTGKEIKDQIANAIIPSLTAKLATAEAEATECLKNCGNAPTHDPDKWWTDGIEMDCGHKVYNWREMEFCENEGRLTCATLSAQDAADKRGNAPEDKAQAEWRQKYNDAIRQICNIKVDLKTCEIMSELKDNDEFELNPRQIIALGF